MKMSSYTKSSKNLGRGEWNIVVAKMPPHQKAVAQMLALAGKSLYKKGSICDDISERRVGTKTKPTYREIICPMVAKASPELKKFIEKDEKIPNKKTKKKSPNKKHGRGKAVRKKIEEELLRKSVGNDIDKMLKKKTI